MKEYPAVRVKLEAIAVKRLEKHKKPLIQQGKRKRKEFSLNIFSFFYLVNLKRSKSTPGLVEASCRLPFYAPIRRAGSGIQRLRSAKEPDVPTAAPSIIPSSSFSNNQQQPLSTSSNSLLAAAPLASSISVTSSLNSHRQRTINHSVSWSITTDTKKFDTTRVGRAISLNNNTQTQNNTPMIANDIERLKKRLLELENQDLTNNSIYNDEYIEIKTRLETLEEEQKSGGT